LLTPVPKYYWWCMVTLVYSFTKTSQVTNKWHFYLAVLSLFLLISLSNVILSWLVLQRSIQCLAFLCRIEKTPRALNLWVRKLHGMCVWKSRFTCCISRPTSTHLLFKRFHCSNQNPSLSVGSQNLTDVWLNEGTAATQTPLLNSLCRTKEADSLRRESGSFISPFKRMMKCSRQVKEGGEGAQ